MKQGKRIKPVFPIEYRMLVMPRFNEREKKHVTLFAIRTINEFKNFRYEISLDSAVEGEAISFNVRGLRAPQVTIPGTGPAVAETEMENLRGDYQVIISKHGKEENIFSVKISADTVKITRSPKKKFVELITNSEDW